MQYTGQTVLFLDFANAKSLITSSKPTERSTSASMQSRDRGFVYNRAFEQSGSTHFGASKLKFAF